MITSLLGVQSSFLKLEFEVEMATPTPSSVASAPSPSGSVSHTPINEPTPIDADTAAASISSDEETAPAESADPLKVFNRLILMNKVLPQLLTGGLFNRRAKDFGGGVFSLAATVMSDLIHKDPTCFPVIDAADLPSAFLEAVIGGVICSVEAICIPQCLGALCLNNKGLQAVKDCNALRSFVRIFTSRTYVRALSGDAPGSLSAGLDELMSHASSLRGLGVDMLMEILFTISKIGHGVEAPSLSTESIGCSAPIPMETRCEESITVSTDGGEFSKMETWNK
ncbi:hypothetical protein IFM89_020323 [Coptis chinensis]|uniref:DUF913 domain-containing protein n=1 Tax=Coptis chinensis TaxID=261450 RepID=A0A835I439_9MAGN|nr:hypothetical protein IFM89_020323 [Coptis chinensis]